MPWKTVRVVLIAKGETRAKVKIQRDISLGDSLSPLLFVIAMIPLNNILRKYTGGYKFARLQEKINHFINMDDMKAFADNDEELKT